MTAPSHDAVTESEARTVKGATVGFCDATTSTTTEYVDLSEWAGRYVKIYCETSDHYFCFGAATGFTMDVDAAAVGTLYVPDRVDAGGAGTHVVIPRNKPWLGYRTVSGAGVIRVLPI